jgi:hypothetical protein
MPEPGEQALTELAKLVDERLCEQGLFQRFFVRLSNITRQYLAAKLSCSAQAQTTEELLTMFSRKEGFAEAQQQMLGAVLNRCDEVKFAGITVGTENVRASTEDCKRFIRKTMEVQT